MRTTTNHVRLCELEPGASFTWDGVAYTKLAYFRLLPQAAGLHGAMRYFYGAQRKRDGRESELAGFCIVRPALREARA